MNGLFLHCRAGFESECASEIQALAAEFAISGYCKAKPNAAYVVFVTGDDKDAIRLHNQLPFAQLIFTRQWFRLLALTKNLLITDRISGLLEACAGTRVAKEVFLETIDTNDGKELQALCRSLSRPLQSALASAKLFSDDAHAPRLHICFLATTAAYVGIADVDNSSPYPMGIPRLRSPSSAPSRSTLKLEEALLTFLNQKQTERMLRTGMKAVDLGAAPGGWTWQLVRRHLRVIAVDNGTMAASLMDSGLVEHLREDGFRYRPAEPVDWMVCDIVEKPARIADLVCRWLGEGDCRYSIFNLKLPMKKRYQEVMQCLERVRATLDATGQPYRLACKQLYHDREEVTVFAALEGR